MDPRKLIIVLMALVIIVPIAAYSVYYYEQPKLKIIKDGSTVSLWYYGYIIVDGTDLIFDTNMASVANNNTTYPKAPDFTYHPPFTPLNDTVGSGQMIKGFDQGLIGMAQGQSGIIVVPPNLGYGNINESLISKINISGYVSINQELTFNQFTSLFKVFPVNGELLTSPIYGWPVQVKSYNQYYVYIQNIPQIGVQYFPYQGISGFSIVPDSINSNNTISYYFAVTNGTILPNGAYISYVGSTYFELNKNPFLAGKTLYFYVDIIKVD